MSCASNAARFSGLSILDCSFVFHINPIISPFYLFQKLVQINLIYSDHVPTFNMRALYMVVLYLLFQNDLKIGANFYIEVMHNKRVIHVANLTKMAHGHFNQPNFE